MTAADEVLAWHWVGNRLRDGRSVPADGVALAHTGPIEICRSGLHASPSPWEAFRYAPGPILCRVRCRGIAASEPDKFVCRERTILARRDMTVVLRYFARMQALSVVRLWPNDPPEVVLDYLMTGDESLRVRAEAAAAAAARAAATGAAAWTAETAAAWAAHAAASWAAAAAAAAAGAADADADADADAGAEFHALVAEEFDL